MMMTAPHSQLKPIQVRSTKNRLALGAAFLPILGTIVFFGFVWGLDAEASFATFSTIAVLVFYAILFFACLIAEIRSIGALVALIYIVISSAAYGAILLASVKLLVPQLFNHHLSFAIGLSGITAAISLILIVQARNSTNSLDT